MFDGNDGGFFNETSTHGEGSTPKAGGKGTSQRAQSILPVNTHQIRNSSEGGVVIGGTEFYLVTLVGRVTAIENTSLKIVYTIEDDRGSINAVHWTDSESDCRRAIVENVLCRLHGSVKSQDGQKFLMVFKIQPVKNLNELTTHRLEVAVLSKTVELAKVVELAKNILGESAQISEMSHDVDVNGKGADLGNSLVNVGGWNNKPSLSHQQKLVFAVIKRIARGRGIHVNEIGRYLTEKLPQNQINKIVDDLMNEGHVYSTIDEFHFLCTENDG